MIQAHPRTKLYCEGCHSNVSWRAMCVEYHSAPKLTAMLAEIGFLTLFEHYKSIEVGRFFKNPRYPVWVVCSERYGCGLMKDRSLPEQRLLCSHYSVLFGLDPALTKGIPSKVGISGSLWKGCELSFVQHRHLISTTTIPLGSKRRCIV